MGINTERYGGALGRAREERDSIREKEGLTLRIPGYEDLQVEYKLMSEAETEAVAKQVQAAQRSEKSKKVIDAVLDFLIASCKAIKVRDDNGKMDDLVDDEEQPVRFDATLAEFLGFDFETAKDVVLETFSPKGKDGLRRNPDAPMDHFQAIASWRRGRSHEIDSDLLGE